MKTLQYLLIISILSCMTGKAYSADPVKGMLQYKPATEATGDGSQLYMASVLIPITGKGVPLQIKAIITTKTQAQKKERYIFIRQQDGRKAGKTFTIMGGNLFAEVGIIDPIKEQISLFLVYRKEQQDSSSVQGKMMFDQQKVDLTGITGN